MIYEKILRIEVTHQPWDQKTPKMPACLTVTAITANGPALVRRIAHLSSCGSSVRAAKKIKVAEEFFKKLVGVSVQVRAQSSWGNRNAGRVVKATSLPKWVVHSSWEQIFTARSQ